MQKEELKQIINQQITKAMEQQGETSAEGASPNQQKLAVIIFGSFVAAAFLGSAIRDPDPIPDSTLPCPSPQVIPLEYTIQAQDGLFPGNTTPVLEVTGNKPDIAVEEALTAAVAYLAGDPLPKGVQVANLTRAEALKRGRINIVRFLGTTNGLSPDDPLSVDGDNIITDRLGRPARTVILASVFKIDPPFEMSGTIFSNDYGRTREKLREQYLKCKFRANERVTAGLERLIRGSGVRTYK